MGVHSSMARLTRQEGQGQGQDDAGAELLDLLSDPFANTLQEASLYSALALSLGFMAGSILLFSILRPYHQSLYAPKLKHADEKHAPPVVGKAPWSWFMSLWNTSEENMIGIVGMDAVVFLRFTSMCRNLFLILTVLGCGILIPIHQANTNVDAQGVEWIEKLTPEFVWGKAIWGQVVVAWLFSVIIAVFLWWNYRKVMQLRRKYFESEDYQSSLHSRTLMLYDLPKQGRSDEGIARIIDQVVPNSSFARTVVARNVKDLPSLISQHESAVRKLEKVLAKYLKNPDKLPPGRPTCKPSRKDPSYDTYPRGQNIDAIEYYTSRIRQLEVEIKQVRSTVDKRGTMPYGFASYADIAEAHNIAYACRNKKPHGATVVLAPRPNDVIWANMPLSKAARNRKRWVSSFWIILLTFLWIAPNAMIAIFLVNLSNLGKFWPGFQRSLEANTQVWGAVQGILSPAIMSLVYLVLPMIFRRLQIKAGDMTKTGRERHVLGKLFAFFFFNNLFVFSVFSVIWTFVANIVQDTEDGQDAWQSILKNNFFALLFVSLCKNSPFWVTYLLQRQLGAAVDIAQLYCLVEAFFLKKMGSPTPRKLIELTAPPPFEYASYYNYFLFYAAVTLCFAPVQPLVLPATALYFIIDYYLKKYLLLYRFVTKTESGGVFWRVLFNRFIFATIFSHLIVLLTTWVRGEGTHIQFYACCPLPFLMLAFKFYCHKAFDSKIRFYSTRNVSKHPEATLQKEDRQRSERLASRFGHPALYKKLITPMVSQKAQNLLPSVYTGRLTDGREGGADDMMSVSGYSDMYALNNMQGGKPGKAANNVPGFEYVAESQMDFEHYKNREEFAEDHGGGEIYGRQGEIMRPNTPGSVGDWSDNGSRPDSPFSNNRMQYAPGSSKRSETGFAAYRPSPALGRNHNPMSDNDLARTQSPLYTHDNSSGSALVRNAAASPMSTPEPYHDAPVDYGHSRAGSGGRATPSRSRSPGPAQGLMGPHGYSGLAQSEHASPREDDSAQYDYFRGGSRPSRRGPGQGW